MIGSQVDTVSIVGSVSRLAGGLFESVRRLHQGLQSANAPDCPRADFTPPGLEPRIRVQVLGLRDPFTETDLATWAPVPVRVFDTRGPRGLGFAPRLFRHLRACQPDLVHVHGIWQFTSLAALLWRRQTGRPLLISAHGMLDRWALRNSWIKKTISWLVYERDHLRSATCLRALCESEAGSIRALGLRNPICVVPNGIDLPDHDKDLKIPLPVAGPISDIGPGKFKLLLYLGRLHPKKGLANLLKAWAQVPRRNHWILVLAGWDQDGHEAELKKLATALRIRWAESGSTGSAVSLLFAGPQFGAAKRLWLRFCNAVILPSFSEGLPMAVLEAWAYRKPVLMTPQCHLPDGFVYRGAFSILPRPDSIANRLGELFQTDSVTLREMGERGHNLVLARYSWSRLVAELQSVYFWMSGRGSKPDCVLAW